MNQNKGFKFLGQPNYLGWVACGVDGLVHTVKCKICLEVEHKNKILTAKWDPLQKHANERRTNKPMKGMKKMVY
jgi:hypothetical protein